jgi:hypothetical protein
MNKFKWKSQFNESTTKIRFQLDHIWINVPRNECKYSVTKAYWLDFHKPIYIACKLPNALPRKPLSSSIFFKCSIQMLHLPSN